MSDSSPGPVVVGYDDTVTKIRPWRTAMPVATVRGVDINYEVLGDRGPWVALQPGGRRALAGVKPFGDKLAEAGCRVLIYDRRNCGASGVSFDGGNSENAI